MRKFLILMLVFFIIFSCRNKEKEIKPKQVKLGFQLEKIVIVNLNEVCITYFKVKISNPSNSSIVLMDNSLIEYYKQKSKPTKSGFYLKNKENDSIVPLGIDNNYFIEVGPKSTGYYFIGAKDLNHSFEIKDSLLLKKALSNYTLEYNGKRLNLNTVKKSKYLSKKNFERIKKENHIPYKDSVSVQIPVNMLKFKYLYKNPIYRDEWDSQ